jgi:hypothetical protein
MARAKIDPMSGRAYIEDGDQEWRLDFDAKGPVDATGLHLGMYFPVRSRVERRNNDGPYPYTALHAELRLEQAKHTAFLSFIQCVDFVLSLETRQAVMAELEKELENEAIRKFVTDVVMEVEPNERAQINDLPDTGHLGELKRELKQKWNR